MTKKQKIYLAFKRLISLFGAFVGILACFVFLWWWVLPVNAIVTKGHPIFIHKRIGYHQKVFGLIKFRSMRVDVNPNLSPSDMNKDTQASMETCFGKFLRKSSIDETLQLLNVFIGQMAFIGPRPGAAINEEFLLEERAKYTPNAFDVKPGMSGLAQIKMKRDHDPILKAKYDHEYVSHISLWLDIKLFVLTIFGVFRHNDGAR